MSKHMKAAIAADYHKQADNIHILPTLLSSRAVWMHTEEEQTSRQEAWVNL
jgi:hypothetical protein